METQEKEVKWYGKDRDLLVGAKLNPVIHTFHIKFHPTTGENALVMIFDMNRWQFFSEDEAKSVLRQHLFEQLDKANLYHRHSNNFFEHHGRDVKGYSQLETTKRVELAEKLMCDLLERRIFTIEHIEIK